MNFVYRTTVILDDKQRVMLKKLSLETNVSQREIITNAITNEYNRWKMSRIKDEDYFNNLWDNKLAFAVMKELDPIIKYTSAKDFFMEQCEAQGITPNLFSYDDFSMKFINLLCKNLSKLCVTKNVKSFKRKMISLKRRK